MQVKFTNFWPTFDEESNFFSRALKTMYPNVNVSNDSRRCELEIVSVFPPRGEYFKRKISSLLSQSPRGSNDKALINVSDQLPPRISDKRIWFTGENIRVPFGQDFDHSFSFDQDSYGGTNTYFPLWQMDLNPFSNFEFNHRVGVKVALSDLEESRKKQTFRKKFACAFIGNQHPMRARLIKELSSVGDIDVFGSAVGKPVRYKGEVASEYRYMICLENDLYPGYVTEKLLDAYVSGCVPIYWGDLGNEISINRKSFINVATLASVEASVDYLRGMNTSSYSEIHSQPFLNNRPSFEQILKVLNFES